jgi:amidase
MAAIPPKRAAVLLFLLAAALAGCSRPPAPPPFNIEEATISDLQKRLESGEDTARSLVERYLARINTFDKNGPALRSVIELNPDALSIADRLDAERRAGKVRGPLHGIPLLIKDNIATADRMTTTAGSLALEGTIAPQDAFVVSRLRAAGAVIFGKTNLSEWANFRSTRSTSGWSGRGGQTRNPYALDRNPSGSSSGSAVAVAASLCAAALGTETDGSIVSPASVNGIVGIKPTLGLVSRTGIIPIAHSQDMAGPMARTVADAAIVLSVLAAADPADAITKNAVTIGPLDYTRFLIPSGLQGVRIGVVRQKIGNIPAAAAVFDAAVADLRRLGAEVVDPVEIPHLNEYGETEDDVLRYEFKADLNAYLGWLGPKAPVHSLEEVMAFNDRQAARSMPYFGQEIMAQAQAKGPLTDPKYVAALQRNRKLAGPEGIDAALKQHQLDALVSPTESTAWLTDLVRGDPPSPSISTVAAVAGYPHVTVPAGFVFGLPVGLSFVGPEWSEPALVRMAYAYEQGTKRRKPPSYLPTAPLAK